MTLDNTVYTGCNVENVSYGATICAERVAILKAVSEGAKDFVKIAVVSHRKEKTFPCGICLQVMEEFMPEGIVILTDGEGVYEYSLKDLLPHAFHTILQ